MTQTWQAIRSSARFSWLPLLLLVLLMTSGCVGASAQLMYVLFGHKTDAEFANFKGKRVAIVTVAESDAFGPNTLSETVSRAISMKLMQNVKKIDVVPHGEIADWMDNHGWGQPDPIALGKGVKADYVLKIEMSDYGIHDGQTMYKGHSSYLVDVFDIKDEGRLVFSRGPEEFIFPRDGRPAIESSERKFEAFYLARLTDKISRYFYSFDSTETAAMDSELMD